MQTAGTGCPHSVADVPTATGGTQYPPPSEPPRFLSRQEKERAAQQQQQPSEEIETKPDVKPRRLATTYLGPPGLLRMIGTGDEEHIITRVIPGTDPLQNFEEDDPSQFIVIDDDTYESSDVDDLSEVSMT